MPEHSTEESEAIAAKLLKDLNEAAAPGKPVEAIAAVLQRIKDEIVWTVALSESEIGRALYGPITSLSSSPVRDIIRGNAALEDLVYDITSARHPQTRLDEIRVTERRWWHTEPVPDEAGRITLSFRDVTAQHKTWLVEEAWAPERVECVPTEAFQRAAQRFRVQANQKYRHPFKPSMCFDAILKTVGVPFDSLGDRTIGDILGDLSEDCAVPYVRNDEKNAKEHRYSPVWYYKPWERTLPSWCVTPDHWVDPIPPPGFVEGDQVMTHKEQCYKKLPTLLFPGTGRNIVPSANKPDIISRSLFLPVEVFAAYTGTQVTTEYSISFDADLVPRGAHLTPGAITLDDARALLGRVVEWSSEPRPDPSAPPAGKRRKAKKSAERGGTVGIAWGLETTPDGAPLWLHCLTLTTPFVGPSEYVLPLSGDTQMVYEPPSPISIQTERCAWVGAAALPADVKALRGKTTECPVAEDPVPEPEESDSEGLSHSDWSAKTKAWIRKLNMKDFEPVTEVGPDGMFVGGDLGTSKGDDDEFEAKITGAKPGIWLMSIEPAEGDEAEEDRLNGENPRVIRFVWASDGTVDYDALPLRGSIRTPDADPHATWEEVGSFSLDSGTVCLFSIYALDTLLSTGKDEDREAMLETFYDDNFEGNVFVPSGIVTYTNDGGYEVEGRRDAEGKIVELRLRV